MEIRLIAGETRQTVAVTMRTPGADFELAAGFLYGEGIISSREEIKKISYCVDADVGVEQRYNIVNVELRGGRDYDLRALERHFYTSSACGVCGKESLDQLEIRDRPTIGESLQVPADTITALPEKLREAQGLFDATGGLHAAGLFDRDGSLLALREGVVAPTVGWREADPDCAPLDVVPGDARQARVRACLSNAFAFGGLNAVLALRAG